jgi:hypothetical protein
VFAPWSETPDMGERNSACGWFVRPAPLLCRVTGRDRSPPDFLVVGSQGGTTLPEEVGDMWPAKNLNTKCRVIRRGRERQFLPTVPQTRVWDYPGARSESAFASPSRALVLSKIKLDLDHLHKHQLMN